MVGSINVFVFNFVSVSLEIYSSLSEGSQLTCLSRADVFRGFAFGNEAPEIVKRYFVLTLA